MLRTMMNEGNSDRESEPDQVAQPKPKQKPKPGGALAAFRRYFVTRAAKKV